MSEPTVTLYTWSAPWVPAGLYRGTFSEMLKKARSGDWSSWKIVVRNRTGYPNRFLTIAETVKNGDNLS